MAVLSLFEFWVRIRVRLRRRLVTFNDDIVLSVYVIFYNFQSMYKSSCYHGECLRWLRFAFTTSKTV